MEAVRSAIVVKSLGASTLLFLVLALAACGSSETKPDVGGVPTGRETAGVDSPAGSGEDLAQSSEGAVGITGDPATLGDFGRKVVKTADLGLRSKEVRGSAARAQQVAATADGTVLSSQVYKSGDSVTADLVLSVPSEEFERVLEELRGLGQKVTTDSISGQDVTEEYVDLESRERNLRATEESLLRLYERAENVEEALSIQRELTGVRGEIELVQGRIKYLDQRSTYSQITLNIQPVTSPPPPRPSWDPGEVVARAWEASLSVLQVMATAIISALVFGWWLAPVLIGGLLWWRRRNRGSRPAATEPS
ncbi:MAG: DUF4349 domain-containing protein [Actinomycetota bacterium]|nr:DUF4349 domain-containing protein [Actinomycetota bacterium]